MNWLNNLFTNADGVTPWWGIALAIVIILIIGAAITGAIILIVTKIRKNSNNETPTKAGWATRELVFGALCIAIAFALSYLKFFQMPFGGAITPASMLPIMMFAYIYGTPKGLIVGLAYGLLQMLQGLFITPLESPILQIVQITMDYGIAFMAIALTGLFRKNFLLGILTGGIGRLIISFLSGLLFFSMYAEGQSAAVYSLLYNITYLGPEIAICFIIALIPGIRKAIDSLKAESATRKKKAQAA